IAFEYDKDNLGTAEAGASSEFDVKILKGNAENNIFKIGDKATIKLSWPKLNNIKIAGIVILKNNEVVFATNTINVKDLTNKNEAKIDINLDIGPGAYKIYSVLFGKDRNDPVAYNNSEDFVISSGKLSGVNGEEWEGIKYLENKWVGNEG
ncbi:MAG: hypothetical protein M0R39_17445, partial [Prolixibacteraceae bacterium]|nr:hypothetical protein [Prolixibacteraceae bacterium]